MLEKTINEIVDRIKRVGYIEEVTDFSEYVFPDLPEYYLDDVIFSEYLDKGLSISSYISKNKDTLLVLVDVYNDIQLSGEPLYRCNYVFGKDSECMNEYLASRHEDLVSDKLAEIRLTALKSIGLPDYIILSDFISKIHVEFIVAKGNLYDTLEIDSPLDEDVNVLKDKIIKYSDDYVSFMESHEGLSITESIH